MHYCCWYKKTVHCPQLILNVRCDTGAGHGGGNGCDSTRTRRPRRLRCRPRPAVSASCGGTCVACSFCEQRNMRSSSNPVAFTSTMSHSHQSSSGANMSPSSTSASIAGITAASTVSRLAKSRAIHAVLERCSSARHCCAVFTSRGRISTPQLRPPKARENAATALPCPAPQSKNDSPGAASANCSIPNMPGQVISPATRLRIGTPLA